jgi:hypothetical protein
MFDSVSILWGDGSDTLFVASDQQMLQHTYAAEGENRPEKERLIVKSA